MKVAVIQARVKSDRPADNLEFIKHALHHNDHAQVKLALLPPLAISGRLGPEALARPGLKAQYDKAWQDFLAVSREFPQQAVATTWLNMESGQEETRAVKNGTPCPEALAGLEVTFRNAPYRGRAAAPPRLGPGAGWRVNVSAVGGDGPYINQGDSYVVDSQGQLKAWASTFGATTIIFDTASQALPTVTPPAPDELATLREALATGLRDYVRDNSGGQVVLGLSGGMDSALVAALAAEALGPENVLAVAMPSEYNASESLELARQLAENLRVKFAAVPIDAIRQAYGAALAPLPKDDEKPGHLADENIQARIRGVLLMYLANREGRLLLATGNKSEGAMGYCTLYGDTCGAIAPIGDVYKTRVYELAGHINREKETIPRRIIDRPPSAELSPGQKDQDALPAYDVLDDILSRHLEGGQTGAAIAKATGVSPMTVAWVLSAHKKAAFKRAQEPFALIASSRPLAGLDW